MASIDEIKFGNDRLKLVDSGARTLIRDNTASISYQDEALFISANQFLGGVSDSTVDATQLGAINSKLDRIDETLGQYSGRSSVSLTDVEEGWVIDNTGTKVEKAGWAMGYLIGQKGNEYLFKAGVTDGNVAIFAEQTTQSETRTIDYTKTLYTKENAPHSILIGYPSSATATYLGQTHTYTYHYELSSGSTSDGSTTSADTVSIARTTITGEGNQEYNALPLYYKTNAESYIPLTVLNANAELPADGYCRYISHFQGFGTIKLVVSYKLGSADTTLKVVRDGFTANIATQLGTIKEQLNIHAERVKMLEDENESLKADNENLAYIVNNKANAQVSMLAGQPSILFGDGTPSETIVPTNWIGLFDSFGNFNPDGFTWTGIPVALGQIYINTKASDRAMYVAVNSGYCALKWLQC